MKISISQLQRTIRDQKSDSKLHFASIKTKCNFAPKRLILCIQFPKFSWSVTPAPVLWEGAAPCRTHLQHGLGPGAEAQAPPFVITPV